MNSSYAIANTEQSLQGDFLYLEEYEALSAG